MSNTISPTYDYTRQTWTLNGIYLNCNHSKDMDCGCYGREHAGHHVDCDGPGLCSELCEAK